jgi:hypothetical protein
VREATISQSCASMKGSKSSFPTSPRASLRSLMISAASRARNSVSRPRRCRAKFLLHFCLSRRHRWLPQTTRPRRHGRRGGRLAQIGPALMREIFRQRHPNCTAATVPCLLGVYGYLGYPTAWMMFQLQNDNYVRGAFVNGTGELFSETKNWQLVASTVL